MRLVRLIERNKLKFLLGFIIVITMLSAVAKSDETEVVASNASPPVATSSENAPTMLPAGKGGGFTPAGEMTGHGRNDADKPSYQERAASASSNKEFLATMFGFVLIAVILWRILRGKGFYFREPILTW